MPDGMAEFKERLWSIYLTRVNFVTFLTLILAPRLLVGINFFFYGINGISKTIERLTRPQLHFWSETLGFGIPREFISYLGILTIIEVVAMFNVLGGQWQAVFNLVCVLHLMIE